MNSAAARICWPYDQYMFSNTGLIFLVSWGSMSMGMIVSPRSAIFCGSDRFAPWSSVLYERPIRTMAGSLRASTSRSSFSPSARRRCSNLRCSFLAARQAFRICERVTPSGSARPLSSSSRLPFAESEKSRTGVNRREASTPWSVSAECTALGKDCMNGQ